MGIIRCAKGHYYDDVKFSKCPHCGIFADDDKTVALKPDKAPAAGSDDKTVAMRPVAQAKPPVDEDDKTVGVYKQEKGVDFIAGWLVCVEGPEKGRDYRLYHGFNRIGRDYKLDVPVMEDPSIARESNCAVVYDGRGNRFYAVQQAGATAYLNGTLLEEPKPIQTGDVIRIGSSEFEFVAFCREGRVWERD